MLGKVLTLGKGECVSRQLITEYRSELDRIHAASGSKRESVVREAFRDLLKRWGKSRELIFLAEHEYVPPAGNRCYIDGALVHSIRVPFGYWEAKDTNDDLDEEITLIDGPRLLALAEKYGVGLRKKPAYLMEVDEAFFAEKTGAPSEDEFDSLLA